MSNFQINNIARVVNVRQALHRELPAAVNEHTSLRVPKSNGVRPGHGVLSVNVQPSNVPAGDGITSVASLAALFNSFFTRLINILSGEKDKAVPVIPPHPLVNLPVTPAPVPAPAPTPLPQPRRDVPAHIPNLSDKRNRAKPDNIWSGFRQGPDGNCVTVSAIKAAMHKFGQSPTDIYKEVLKTPGGYRVTMCDDVVVSLTDQELKAGAASSRFIGPDKGMLKDAQFLFSVSAKRAQNENNDGWARRSYGAALKSLNDGEDEWGPGEGFKRLGLRKHMRTVNVRELADGQVGMCNRARHSVAVINGREELWGRQGAQPTRGDAIALV